MVGLSATAPSASLPASPLLSAQWFRVAGLRPRLVPAAAIERVRQRQQTWHLLSRAGGGRSFRLNDAAWGFAGRCDGRLSVQQLWDLLLAEHRDASPTQDELLQLMSQMHAAGLLEFDRPPTFARGAPIGDAASAQADESKAPRRAQSLLSFQIPLGCPDAWLNRLARRAGGLFQPLWVWAWLALVGSAAVLALLNVSELAHFARTWLGSPRLVFMAWLAYPVIKALHELAHALTLKHFGGRVPEWGLTLMMFTPVPHVDASDAARLPLRHQRLLVSGAGMGLELALAALALWLALGLGLEPGFWRDLCLCVFFIGSVSTLLVNGNPLLRFDGYHLLCDALALPNLASRSTRHWLQTLQQQVLGLAPPQALQPAPGERPWLWAHAPAALAWRLIIGLALVTWLGRLSTPLGLVAAAYLAWLMLLRPGLALWQWLAHPLQADSTRDQGRRRLGWGLGAAAVLLLALPLPQASVVQGVVWLPEQAQVRAATEGWIAELLVQDGQAVQAGQLLMRLQAPELIAELARLEGQVEALDTERFQALRADPARAVALGHELARAQAEWARLQDRAAQLEVRAGRSGQLALAHASDLPGRHVKQGTVLAQVLSDEPTQIRVALPQAQARLVQLHTQAVSVRLSEQPTAPAPARLLPGTPGAVLQLPSAALGDRHGGDIVTDPTDPHGLTAAQAVVLLDVQLRDSASPRSGGRAWVRFDHGHLPWALQLARQAQQQVLSHFNPAQ